MRVGAILLIWCACVSLDGVSAEDAPSREVLYEGKSASHWIAELKGSDIEGRRRAAYALFKLGPAAKSGAEVLARTLEDEDEYVRATAYKALLTLGQDARLAVKALRSALNDGRPRVRQLAMWALLRIDPKIALRDDDFDVRKAALMVLADPNDFFTETIFGELLTLALDEDEEIRTWTARAIATAYMFPAPDRPYLIPEKARLVRVMCRVAAKDEEPQARHGAVYALQQLARYPKGPDLSGSILPTLIAATRDASPDVRSMAFISLSTKGKNEEAEKACLAGLKDKHASVRATAAARLSSVSEGGPSVVAALIPMLADDDRFVRYAAAGSLGWFAEKSASAVPALTELVRVEKFPGVFAKALGGIGPSARSALPTLEAAFVASKEPSSEIAYALLRLGTPNREAALNRLVDVALSPVGGGARPYLGAMGSAVVPVLPRIIEALSKGDSDSRRQAAWTLRALGPVAAQAVPALEALLTESPAVDEDLAIAVREALTAIRGQ